MHPFPGRDLEVAVFLTECLRDMGDGVPKTLQIVMLQTC